MGFKEYLRWVYLVNGPRQFFYATLGMTAYGLNSFSSGLSNLSIGLSAAAGYCIGISFLNSLNRLLGYNQVREDIEDSPRVTLPSIINRARPFGRRGEQIFRALGIEFGLEDEVNKALERINN